MRIRLALVLTVCAAVLLPAAPAAGDPAPDLEALLVDLANGERARRGIPALAPADDLAAVAGAWTVEMVERRIFFHNPGLSTEVCCWAMVGENLGYRMGSVGGDAVAAVRGVHADWMASPDHRATMLEPAFREVGLAVEVVPDPAGRLWYLVSAVYRDRDGVVPVVAARGPRGAGCGMPATGGVSRSADEERRRGLPRCGTDDGGPTPPSPRRIEEFCAGSPTAGYRDVAVGNVHRRAIDCVTARDIARGKADGRFGVAEPLRRDQAVALLARSLRAAGVDLPAPEQVPDYFTDDEASVHERDLNVFAHLGILATSRPLVAPATLVDRAEMAALAEAALRVGGSVGAGLYDYFRDDAGLPHEGAINRLAFLGGATGTGDGAYRPAAGLRRDAAASYLARVLTLLHD